MRQAESANHRVGIKIAAAFVLAETFVRIGTPLNHAEGHGRAGKRIAAAVPAQIIGQRRVRRSDEWMDVLCKIAFPIWR